MEDEDGPGGARLGTAPPAGDDPSSALRQALSILGDRWSLLIVAHLLRGPHRFSSILRMTPGISANVLTKRLRNLEARGVLEHRSLSSTVEVPVYALSRWGAELDTAVSALERWISTRT